MSLNSLHSNDALQRCDWCGDDTLYQHYHDTEWGRPVCDDQKHFEILQKLVDQGKLKWSYRTNSVPQNPLLEAMSEAEVFFTLDSFLLDIPLFILSFI